MDTERIERALRDGPPNEPVYVLGGFRRSSPPGWWLAVAGLSVGVALVAGIAIGTGIDALRSGGVGDEPEPRVLVAADLQGVWESDPIEFQAWVDALLARGFTQEDVDAFLEHDPFQDHLRYALRIVDERLTVQAAFDDLPFQTLSGGTFTVLDDGTVHFIEGVDGVQVGCEVTVAAAIDDSRLMLNVLDLRDCGVDERMANTLFFEVAAYARVEE